MSELEKNEKKLNPPDTKQDSNSILDTATGIAKEVRKAAKLAVKLAGDKLPQPIRTATKADKVIGLYQNYTEARESGHSIPAAIAGTAAGMVASGLVQSTALAEATAIAGLVETGIAAPLAVPLLGAPAHTYAQASEVGHQTSIAVARGMDAAFDHITSPQMLPALAGSITLGLGGAEHKRPSASATSISQSAQERQKQHQQQRLQQALIRERIRDSSLNSFAPFVRYQPPAAPAFTPRPYSLLTNYGSFYPSSTKPMNLHRIIRDAVERELYSGAPSLFSAYLRASAQLGLGYNLSLAEFRSVLSSTSLIASYNSVHSSASVRAVLDFYREIGGVGTEVACITDLVNSETQIEAEDYQLCFSQDDLPVENHLLVQIAHELYQGYFTHKTLPFFSLHFNKDGALYPVIHPAYQNTLVGKIIGFLDYWMKGFLNGGIFDEDFLATWHTEGNRDETWLKSQLIHLNDYCKRHTPDLDYASLRERQSRAGVKEEAKGRNSAYTQPFMTSFRIIAYQKSIRRHENVLLPEPAFRVEYTIEPMPDYAQYLEAHKTQHGSYPEEYEILRQSYESFAEEVREKMPQLPFCRDFFKLLGVMNALCYFVGDKN